MTKEEIVRESLEIMEHMASFFYLESTWIECKKAEERRNISKICTDFVVKLKGELK